MKYQRAEELNNPKHKYKDGSKYANRIERYRRTKGDLSVNTPRYWPNYAKPTRYCPVPQQCSFRERIEHKRESETIIEETQQTGAEPTTPNITHEKPESPTSGKRWCTIPTSIKEICAIL